MKDKGGKQHYSWVSRLTRTFNNCEMRTHAKNYVERNYPNADTPTQMLAFGCFIAGWLAAAKLRNAAMRIEIDRKLRKVG